MMTKADFLTLIEHYPDDAPILLEHREEGYIALEKVSYLLAEHRPNVKSYSGDYAEIGPEPQLISDFVGHQLAYDSEVEDRKGAVPVGRVIILKGRG